MPLIEKPIQDWDYKYAEHNENIKNFVKKLQNHLPDLNVRIEIENGHEQISINEPAKKPRINVISNIDNKIVKQFSVGHDYELTEVLPVNFLLIDVLSPSKHNWKELKTLIEAEMVKYHKKSNNMQNLSNINSNQQQNNQQI